MEQEAFFQLLMNYGGMGILAGVMIWLHLKAVRDFRDERDVDRKARHEAANLSQKTVVDLTAAFERALQRLFDHWDKRLDNVCKGEQ